MKGELIWESLITRYGPPLTPESFDEDGFKQAVVDRRALHVTTINDGFGGGFVYFRRAKMDDALRGGDRLRRESYFCIVFSQPCELTEEEVAGLDDNGWEKWSDVLRTTR